MIRITKLKEDRWEDYRSLRLKALESDPLAFLTYPDEEKDLSPAKWKNRLKNVIFALKDDRPIGMVAYVCETKAKTRHIANIYSVYVERSYRGQGIANKLMDAVLKEISKREDVRKIKLGVNAAQKTALNLYLKYGFQIAGRLKKELLVSGRFYDIIMLEKFIDS